MEHATYQHQISLHALLQAKKKSVTTDRKYTENKLDTLSLLVLAERSVTGVASVSRMDMTKLCVGLVTSTGPIYMFFEIRSIDQTGQTPDKTNDP